MSTDLNLECNKAECTLFQTGACVLGNDPDNCSERFKDTIGDETNISQLLNKELLAPETNVIRLTAKYTLGIEDVDSLMNKHFCRVIGILGAPNSGKTACLVSLYLMLAHGTFGEYDFLDSKTLRAFEEICRGARKWNSANVPEKLTNRTEIQDERTPGFLHLKLQNRKTLKMNHIILPDLPGEWSTTFIDKNRYDRLEFLKATEFIWLMVNSKDIHTKETRHATVHRLCLLIQRLNSLLEDHKPDLILVVSHIDKYDLNPDHLKKLEFCAEENGFNFKAVGIASFSDSEDIDAGTGITNLIEDIMGERPEKFGKPIWPTKNIGQLEREIFKFGLYD